MKVSFQKILAALLACALCLAALGGCSADSKNSSAPQSAVSQGAASQGAGSQGSVFDVSWGWSDEKYGPGVGSLAAGDSVGSFSTEDINGTAYTQEMFGDYDLTVLNVFATWCTPCVQELPELQKLYENMSDKGVNVVGIVMDTRSEKDLDQDAIAASKQLAEQAGAAYPYLIPDETWLGGKLAAIDSFPTTYFIDRNGLAVCSPFLGGQDLEGWTATVEEVLEKMKGGAQ